MYMLLDGDVPFYVGKGTHANRYADKYRRPHLHILEAQKPVSEQTNKLKCAYITKMYDNHREMVVKIVADNISEKDAIELESDLIRRYKRLNEGGTLTNLVSEQQHIAHELRNKSVYCFDISGTLLYHFPSIKKAGQSTGCSTSGIVLCCKGKYKTSGGYMWSYTNVAPVYVPMVSWNKQSVDCYLPNGQLIATYHSITEAATQTGISQSNISASIISQNRSTCGGFVWLYHGDPFVLRMVSPKGRRSRIINQYNDKGVLIGTYNSIKEAEAATGILGSGISHCCNKKKRVAGGFFWAYDGEMPVIRQAWAKKE